MTLESLLSAASVLVAVLALAVTSLLLVRQSREIAHERNATALLEATARMNDPVILDVFARLQDLSERYATDEAVRERFAGSVDESDFRLITPYMETVACLARRRVIDASLIADTMGRAVRRRWLTIEPFVARQRRIYDNPYILENFEWLARYCAWWKDTPRPANDENYSEKQFAGIIVRV